MATQHLKYTHYGIDLDTGAEYDVRALIAITDDDVTYTVRSATDRTLSRTLRVPRAEAPFFLSILGAIAELARAEQDRQPV